jgi:hypothetical protein
VRALNNSGLDPDKNILPGQSLVKFRGLVRKEVNDALEFAAGKVGDFDLAAATRTSKPYLGLEL